MAWTHATRTCLTMSLVWLAAPPAAAATMLGTLLRDGQPPGPGLQLRLSCGDKPEASARTDARGGYRLTVAGAGRCRLSVDGASAEVMLSNQAPAQYDFDLRGSGAAATLQRR
jgi:hypothetical protein